MTGPRGTGKSHFALVLANFVRRNPDDEAMQPFWEKLRADEEAYELARRARERTHPYLVVIPNPAGDPHGVDHALQVALNEALQREGVSFRPSSVYSAAVDKIRYWQQNDPEAYQKLQRELGRLGCDVDIIQRRLDNCDSDAYEAFTKAHREVAHNTEFNPPISDTAELYEETCKFLRRQADQRWQGIFVIWDEFGTYLAGIARTPHSRENQRLQSFIEFCKRSSDNQVHLVAIAHQSFEAYAGGESAKQEFEKLHGRLMDSEYYLRAATDLYEMEEMTNSVIVQHAESQAWNEIRNHKDLDVLVDKVVDWDLYKGKDRTWVSNVIVRGCYPMHPIAMFCLPWLADRVGQETRSLFCFFGDARNGGLMEFVRGREAVDQISGRLCLYTVDLLANYFAPGMQNSSEYRRTAIAMNEAMPQCGESELARRVVQTVAVLEIVDHSRLRPTEDVIADSLWLGNEERKELSGVLAELRDKGALKYRQSTKEYSLRSVAVGIDVEEAINQEIKRIADTFDLAAALQELGEIELSLTADKYNDRHFTNRPVDWKFLSPSSLQYDVRPSDPNGCTVLYVLAETEDDIKDVEYRVWEPTRNNPQLVVAIPKTPVTYRERALRLKAIRNLLLQESASKPSSPEYKQELLELQNETWQQLKNDMRDWLAPEGFVWYNAGNVARQVKDLDVYLSGVLEHVFPRMPAIKDKAINHFAKKDSERRSRLEALDKILRSDGTFQIKKSGGTAVDRILRACVKETEIAEKRGESGDYETFTLRAQPPVRSVLQDVWAVISNYVLARDGTVTLVSEVVKALREPPYGMTPQSIEMVLGSFLGTIIDGCVLRRNSDFQEPSGATVHEMVENPSDWAIVYYVASDEDRQYVKNIRALVGATEKLVGMSIWDAGKKALSDWFRNLPRVSRAGFGYPEDCEELCSNVVKLLSNPAAAVDARKFLKEELPRA